jgi:ABC-2 type transport system permease protein
MSSVNLTLRVPQRYSGATWRMYRSEVRLILGRRRNLALLFVLGVIPILIGIAVSLSTPRNGEGPPFLGQISGNGLFLVFTALSVSMPVFLPLVVGVVAGDSIAGEAGIGTLRYLLTVPVTRGRLLLVKTLGTLTFTAAAVLVVGVAGMVTGAILFGLHDITLLSGDTVSLDSGLLRSLLVVLYVTVALSGLAAGGIFISTLTENAIAAMAATVGISVLSFLLDAVPQLSAIHPYLLTHNWLGFGELLRGSVNTANLLQWSLLHLSYAAVFLSLGWSRLTTKDITS